MSSRSLSVFKRSLLRRKCELPQQKVPKSQTVIKKHIVQQRREPNPEYHHAPSTYVKNFKNYQQQIKKENTNFAHWNARYRWADFRRRMIYGTHDI
ncbi:uncharacterized protein LOC6580374 [Drosophila mojavensis]|uniref:Uncharacterized protein n=1 Tax=Drosophila mojavensis TaxID=7230 RepID=B4KPF9_DROMO|nr:uncharacterized protein LOC6580374 [Drosophila mojavensis]EDW10155.1 uncharacterized protein Dmoj_GI20923 [Drosophila mojavensis]